MLQRNGQRTRQSFGCLKSPRLQTRLGRVTLLPGCWAIRHPGCLLASGAALPGRPQAHGHRLCTGGAHILPISPCSHARVCACVYMMVAVWQAMLCRSPAAPLLLAGNSIEQF